MRFLIEDPRAGPHERRGDGRCGRPGRLYASALAGYDRLDFLPADAILDAASVRN